MYFNVTPANWNATDDQISIENLNNNRHNNNNNNNNNNDNNNNINNGMILVMFTHGLHMLVNFYHVLFLASSWQDHKNHYAISLR